MWAGAVNTGVLGIFTFYSYQFQKCIAPTEMRSLIVILILASSSSPAVNLCIQVCLCV